MVLEPTSLDFRSHSLLGVSRATLGVLTNFPVLSEDHCDQEVPKRPLFHCLSSSMTKIRFVSGA